MKDHVLEIVISVGFLVYLMMMKEDITPDFFHFLMCLHEDYCHYIWIAFLWFSYKCYFIKQKNSENISENSNITLILIECLAGLLLAGELNLSTLIIFGLGSGVFILRLKLSTHVTLALYFFLFIYLTSNFVVNMIDFGLFKLNQTGYYHDYDFLKSFSYKIYQALLGAIFSFLYAQIFQPSD